VLRALYVTNPFYEASGRVYGEEDVYLSRRLQSTFDVHTCLPTAAPKLMADFDVVVVRNSGPVLTYREAYESFREQALATGQPVYNEVTGKADMLGKGYLLELYREGYPVIPTSNASSARAELPLADRYVVKPLHGADSAGLYVATPDDLATQAPSDAIAQPLLDVAYEVSFYFVNSRLTYALYTPDPGRRWELAPYEPTAADIRFAQRFIEWNDIRHGIQRVDACRTVDGDLLLLELEDLNPFLSLDRTTHDARELFVRELVDALGRLCR
jgi:hypothetical protein